MVTAQPTLSGLSVCCDGFTFSGDLQGSPGSELSRGETETRKPCVDNTGKEDSAVGLPRKGTCGHAHAGGCGGLHVGKGWKSRGRSDLYAVSLPS